MPLYQVQHSIALTAEQQDTIAQIITSAHSRRFNVPKLFVNVSFQDLASSVEYVAGRRAHPNRIFGIIRPAPDRSDEAIEALLKEIHEGWDKHIGAQGEQSLSGIFAQTSLQVIVEKGIVIPKAGFDFEWIEKNMAYFKERAAKGDTEFGELVEELEARSK